MRWLSSCHLWLADFIPDLFHRRPDLIDLVFEKITDEQIGDEPFQVRETLYEAAEAEAVVVGANESPHPLHSLNEAGLPLTELRARGVPFFQAVADCVGRHLAGAE